MKAVEMRIEEPAWKTDRTKNSGADNQRYIWTNNSGQHGEDHPDKDLDAEYRYLPWAFMHELGHAFGLEDLKHFRGYGGI